MTPTLPVGKRRFRHAAVLRAALGQAFTCQYLHGCGTAIKAQGHVKNLNRRIDRAPSIKTRLTLCSATIEVANAYSRNLSANMRNQQ
jgi:hypothetical protein